MIVEGSRVETPAPLSRAPKEEGKDTLSDLREYAEYQFRAAGVEAPRRLGVRIEAEFRNQGPEAAKQLIDMAVLVAPRFRRLRRRGVNVWTFSELAEWSLRTSRLGIQ